MAKICCLCGRKIGGFGEDRYDIPGGYYACYKCGPDFRDMQIAKTVQELESKEASIVKRLNESGAGDSVREAVLEEIREIKSHKKELYQRERVASMPKRELFAKKEEFLVTTGYNFEGYRIIKYIGIVHGEAVLGTGFLSELAASISDLFGASSEAFVGKISEAKGIAQDRLVMNGIVMGANAVIGIDFDITTFSNNMVGVSANGTAVIIERE